jgi:hypothetical protein
MEITIFKPQQKRHFSLPQAPTNSKIRWLAALRDTKRKIPTASQESSREWYLLGHAKNPSPNAVLWRDLRGSPKAGRVHP